MMSNRAKKVKKNYEAGFLTKKMVWDVVGRKYGITAEEYKEITGEEYKEDDV